SSRDRTSVSHPAAVRPCPSRPILSPLMCHTCLHRLITHARLVSVSHEMIVQHGIEDCLLIGSKVSPPLLVLAVQRLAANHPLERSHPRELRELRHAPKVLDR